MGARLCALERCKNGSESAGEERGTEVIGEGDALTNQVGIGSEVLLKDGEGLVGSLDGIFNVLLVVGVAAKDGAEPATKGREDLSVGVRHPSQDGGVVLLGLAEQAGLLVLRGDWGRRQYESTTKPKNDRKNW